MMEQEYIWPAKFYIVELRARGRKEAKHFVAQSDNSKNQGEYYWMDFFKKTDSPGEFVPLLTSKNCLVALQEVVIPLSSPIDVLTSSSRAGKLQFDTEELQPYLDTLQWVEVYEQYM